MKLLKLLSLVQRFSKNIVIKTSKTYFKQTNTFCMQEKQIFDHYFEYITLNSPAAKCNGVDFRPAVSLAFTV